MIRSISKPDKFYIGSSCHVYRRRNDHKSSLRRKIHGSILLQNHYNKHGIEDLEFIILCECDRKDLVATEQWYLDAMSPTLNVLKTASWHKSEKLSRKRGAGWNLKAQKLATLAAQEANKIPVLQYTEDGRFVKEWPSINEAGKGMGYPGSTMQATVNHNECSGVKDGFYWCLKDGENIPAQVVPPSPENKRLFQYDLDGNIVGMYRGGAQAVREKGWNRSTVHAAANGINKTCHGFMLSWEIPYMACYRKIYGEKPSRELINEARERYYMEYGAPNAPVGMPKSPSPAQGGMMPPVQQNNV